MFGFDLKQFDADDVALEDLRAHERDILARLGNERARLEAMSQLGPAWSIFKNGVHISSGGVVPTFAFTGEVWQLPTFRVQLCTFSYAKFYKNFISRIFSTGPFLRLETRCLHDNFLTRWMEFIDFELEGVARGFGFDGKDYGIWARLKNGC